MTSLEQHIADVISQADVQEEFMDVEYLDSQCPNCKVVFGDDDHMLGHVCLKDDTREY